MSTIRLCDGCLQPLPENAPEGLCPQCLAKSGVETKRATSSQRKFPEPAELAHQFPLLEIIELLGAGGMGMVYKALQPRLDRMVALKLLPVGTGNAHGFAERFNREAKALARLNHPGIVAVYDFGETSDYRYFVMEYVKGMNLRQLLHGEPIFPRQALDIVVQICTALQYAHDEGVVHRDIKPENILLNQKGQVKIADFGLAKLLGDAADMNLTQSQAAMGTLNYMAPEQRENSKDVDHRADIFSLGVVFYEMLTGELPIGRFAPPSQKVSLDVRLDDVVLKSLEKDPNQRYQRASEVKTSVEDLNTQRAVAPGNAPEIPPPPCLQTITGAERMSAKAIAGSALTGLSFSFAALSLLLMPASPRLGTIPAIVAAALAIPCSIAGTLFGATAILDIHRSTGRIRGLPLALFASLFFPLLLFDMFMTLAAGFVFASLLHALLRRPATLMMGPPEFVLCAIPSLAIDFFVVRAIWRWAQGDRPQTRRLG